VAAGFTALLDPYVEKANTFYMDRVEDAVILLHALGQYTDQLCVGKPQPQFRCACQHSLVTLNFQLLLLQHFVALNFTAVSKILKKFEKKLGVQLRNEYIGALVELPFYRCETLGELVEETERQFNLLQQRGGEAAKAVGAPECWAASSALDSQQQQQSAQCCNSSPAELMPPPPPAIPACGQVPT